MKVFHCAHCQQLVFFENGQCTNCGRLLAYLPDLQAVTSLDQAADGTWTSPWSKARGLPYKLCQNATAYDICNWTVAANDPDPLCRSCRLTEIIPDLARPGFKQGWRNLEVAKRRLLYSLATLGLATPSKAENPQNGLQFHFVSDADRAVSEAVLTGHDNGLITINVAESDDVERERRRLQLHEPYRTLLGHFRHEIGHYYWDQLIQDSAHLEAYRNLFGDERVDYQQALKSHYDTGPPGDWQQRFVSAYATTHPWEDWAETWAHYLHMSDSVETAVACGLSLKPPHRNEPELERNPALVVGDGPTFDKLIAAWFPVTYVLNILNRGLGLADAYPFVLTPPVIEKLRFIHDVIASHEVRSRDY